ncbi:MAG TPA: DUF1353 domain-containing protein [Jatrophihabitans sp.]|nr:DUF1353 domain-containing protein [Jatrophihabitans sp.]
MPFIARRPNPDLPADGPPEPIRLAYFSVREVKQRVPADAARKVKTPRWQLCTTYGYRAEDGRYFAVPAQTGGVDVEGQYTDLASVPGFLWGLLGPYGRQLRPALLHDHLCNVAEGKVPAEPDDRNAAGQPVPPGRTPVQIRKEADYLFREALRSEGVPPVRSWLFFTGVSFGRFLTYARWLALLLGALAGLFGVLAWHALTVALGGGPRRVDGWLSERWFWLVFLGIAVLLAAGLRRRLMTLAVLAALLVIVVCLSGADPAVAGWSHSLGWHAGAAGVLLAALAAVGLTTDVRVALITAVVVPVILPVVLATLLAQEILALPDLVNWALHGYPDDQEPDPGPLLGPATRGRF